MSPKSTLPPVEAGGPTGGDFPMLGTLKSVMAMATASSMNAVIYQEKNLVHGYRRKSRLMYIKLKVEDIKNI